MTVYIPEREQSYALWGRLDGSVVHTSLEVKHPSAPGSRAQSVNTICELSDRHTGEVLDIRPSRNSEGHLRFVSAGADGCIKYWQFNSPIGKAKKRNNDPDNMASIICLHTTEPVTPLEHRSEEIKRRRSGAPDPVLLARCDALHNVLCGVTEDGDLRVWWDLFGKVKEARVDVGTTEDRGPIKALELDVQDDVGLVISVLVLYYRSTSFFRYDIRVDLDGDYEVEDKEYITPMKTPITVIKAYLEPTAPISTKSRPMPALLSTPTHDSDSESSPELQPQPDPDPTPASIFGQFLVAGDAEGNVWIWSWETQSERNLPIRGWSAVEHRISSVDYNCGIVAVGR